MDSDRNSLWASIFVEELSRAGLKRVCIAPGSRSTPLAMAFAKNTSIQTYVLIDERSVSYFSLGLAMSTERPVAVLTSSGTAVANLYPAIIEARQSSLPLIILTADRPHELRQSGANQSIDQVKIFGDSVKWFIDLPLPEEVPSMRVLRFIRTLAGRAYAYARQTPSGPVHLNFPFRKPLEPSLEDGHVPDSFKDLEFSGREAAQPYTKFSRGTAKLTTSQIKNQVDLIKKHPRGLIVLGPRAGANKFLDSLIDLSDLSGYPVLADPLSGARFSALVNNKTVLCGGYDWYLNDEGQEPPEIILRFGSLPTSASLQGYLGKYPDTYQIGFVDGTDWNDPSHRLDQLIEADSSGVCKDLVSELKAQGTGPSHNQRWRDWFRTQENRIWEVIDRKLSGVYSEGLLAADLVNLSPEGTPLFIASSLPIRHIDQFAKPTKKDLMVFSNRGASGIDGTLSSAAGVAAGLERPVTILVGDLAFHHDQTGLLALQRYASGSNVVLINNGGGGIFHRLPISQYEPQFTEFFKTPIKVDFKALTLAYGGNHDRVINRSEFIRTIERTKDFNGFRVIEYISDIEQNEAMRMEIKSYLRGSVQT